MKLSECCIGENMDHECDRDSVKKQSIFGVVSAFIMPGYGNSNFLYWYSCELSYAILRVYDPKPYRCKKVSWYNKIFM